MKRLGLRHKFALALTAVVLLALSANVIWNVINQESRMIAELDEKAAILDEQMMSVWDFVSINQDLINYDSNGNFEFKRLHCSVVGMSIGKLFSERTDYTIRYASPKPRNPFSSTDDYENAAFTAFSNDKALDHVSGITEYNNRKVFRYVAPMVIDKACISCHGGTAGELDILDYPKEGLAIGDIYGTVSIIMPIELYKENTDKTIIFEVIFAALALSLITLLTYLLMTRWITKPLFRLRNAAGQIAQGEWNTEISDIQSKDEVGDLARDFKLMAKQLKTAYDDLEKQVENRTVALRNANLLLETQSAQLQRINEQLTEDNLYKSNFLSIMSHELRTPLTSIIAFVAQLQKADSLRSERSERTERLLRELNTSGQILLEKINNILDTARLDAGRVDISIETVDIGDVVAAVEHVMQPIADNAEIAFSASIQSTVPLIETDADKLRSMLDNLVGNALKFTKTGGSVALNITFDADSDQLHIDVTDTGIGIAKEEHDLVFERFIQSDSGASRKYGGNGLGLSLVKEYALLLGGDVTLQSELGKGSTFRITLPRVCDKKVRS